MFEDDLEHQLSKKYVYPLRSSQGMVVKILPIILKIEIMTCLAITVP